MKKIGILYNPVIETAYALAKDLEKFLSAKGVSTWLCSAWETENARAQVNGTDFLLSVGGDGTILRAVHAAIPDHTPVTGINLGKLGFMTEISAGEAEAKLNALLAGEGWIDERAMIEAELASSEQGNRALPAFHALNDVVVSRGLVTKVVYVEASINGEVLTTYKADGVIVATATGSTGYSLAAGGPILHPQAKDLILLPILPHLSSSYCLVLPPSATVKLRINAVHQATLSIDGHISLPVNNGDTVTVKLSSATARFLRIHPNTFYGSLERKLKGKVLG